MEKTKLSFGYHLDLPTALLTLEDNTIFCYKCTGPYSKESEGTIHWNDPQLNIDWNINKPIVSSKDQEAELFKHFKSPF